MRWHAPRARRHTKRAGQAIPKDPSADQINQSGRSDTESIPTGLIGTLLKNSGSARIQVKNVSRISDRNLRN
jgi:hypothetical protein